MKDILTLRCERCRKPFKRARSQHVHRIKRGIAAAFCSRTCSGMARRTSHAEKKKRKADYDACYRTKHARRLKRQKKEHFARTYDPDAARVERKKRAHEHADYIRRYYADPKHKSVKVAYDLDRRAAAFGPYADAYKLLIVLNRELLKRAPDKYERAKARGYYDEGGIGWTRNELTKSRRAMVRN